MTAYKSILYKCAYILFKKVKAVKINQTTLHVFVQVFCCALLGKRQKEEGSLQTSYI